MAKVEKSRYLLALLHLYEEEAKQENEANLNINTTLTKAEFSPGEITYITEFFEKRGLLKDVGFFGKAYRLTDEAKKVIKNASNFI